MFYKLINTFLQKVNMKNRVFYFQTVPVFLAGLARFYLFEINMIKHQSFH